MAVGNNLSIEVRSRPVRAQMLILATLRWSILFGILAHSATAAEGWRVVDGDTVVTPSGLTVRVANIDAPEAPGKCKCELECRQAEAATAYVRASLRLAGVVELRPYVRPVDRYGRTLAYVLVDGKDLGDEMVSRGLARKWEGRRRSWCR
jgi:micrococcal nuclease